MSLNAEPNKLYLRLSYAVLDYVLYQVQWTYFGKCRQIDNGEEVTVDTIAALQQSANYSDMSITNCSLELTLSQLLGVETWGNYKNGFYIQYGGENLESGKYRVVSGGSQGGVVTGEVLQILYI